MEHLYGLMAANMKVNLKITTLKDLDIMFGWMEGSMRVPGEIIRCMEEVYLYGPMVANIKVNI
jgi:hypothetical protein